MIRRAMTFLLLSYFACIYCCRLNITSILNSNLHISQELAVAIHALCIHSHAIASLPRLAAPMILQTKRLRRHVIIARYIPPRLPSVLWRLDHYQTVVDIQPKVVANTRLKA